MRCRKRFEEFCCRFRVTRVLDCFQRWFRWFQDPYGGGRCAQDRRGSSTLDVSANHAVAVRRQETDLPRNIWAPDLQPDVVDAIGLRYGFSERLKAILRTTPPANSSEAPVENYTAEKEFDLPSVPDVEQGIPTPLTRLSSTLKAAKPNTRNFFNIAANFSSYQSIDIGEKCEYGPCVGDRYVCAPL